MKISELPVTEDVAKEDKIVIQTSTGETKTIEISKLGKGEEG